MPEQVIKTHISDQREAQIAQTCVAQYQQVRDASASVEDAQVEALYARYEWGRALCNAVTNLEDATQTEFAEVVGTRLDKSASYVQHHIRYARACTDEYPGYDPPVAGYVAEAQDEGRQLTWSAAISWMSSSTDEETDAEDEKAQHLLKEVERKMKALDEAADQLAEKYLAGKTGGQTEDVEGVLTQAEQMLEDTKLQKDALPDEAPERLEDEDYLRWLAGKPCVVCGVMDETIVPHHLRAFIEETGIATKPDDYDTLPLCDACHRDVEDSPSLQFWKETPIENPLALARAFNRQKFIKDRQTDA